MAMDEINPDPSDTSDWICQDGDIRVKYHPSSGRELESFRFEEFKQAAPASAPPEDPEPWKPFKTRADFEFVAIAQDAGLSKAQVNSLIGLFHRCLESGKDSFTLSSHNEMHNTLKVASERLAKVCLRNFMYVVFSNPPLFKFEKKTVSVTYKDQPHEFNVWGRPIWTWIEDMLQNPDLIQHFEWDACHMSKFDEESASWVQFYDGPWTASQFWEIQVCGILYYSICY
jgi:hypothetical protein